MGNWQLAATPSTLKAREETSPLLLPSGFSCLRRWRRERRQTDFLISSMYIATAAKNFFSREHISLYLSLPFLILDFPFAVCTVGAADDYHLAACWARAPSAFFFFLRIGKMLMVCYKGRNNTAGCLFPRLLSPQHTLRNLVQFDIEIQSTLFLSIRLFALVTLGNDRPGFSRCNPLLCLPRYSLITCHFIPLRKRPESFSMISCRATTCSFICCFLSLEDNNNKKMRFPWKIDVELVFFPFSVVVGFSLFFPRVCAGCRLMEIPRFNWHLMTSLFTRMKGKALWPT